MGQVKGQRHLKRRCDANFDVAEALLMRVQKELTYTEIGKLYGITAGAVHKRLRPFSALMPDHRSVVAFKNEEVTLLDSVRMCALGNMVEPDRMAKASARDLAVIYGIMFDKMRLLRNQSTSNVGLHATVLGAWGRGHQPAPLEPPTDE